ncbi:MAG: aroE [Solirubrobacteraceae bacterium]|nr:aroE [Solirubrobacteraceae bacterium]
MARYGVLGWPVAHSRSPAMFAALDVPYQLLGVPPELFEETVRALGAAGFGGANVTIPHKEAALSLADEPTERASAIGAANTLTFADGAIAADNTDAPGLIAALPLAVRGKTALVLGSGGSARAAVWALIHEGAEVRVWNRTPERARGLASELGAEAVSEAVDADLLVNCTSIGLVDASASEVPDFKLLPLAPDELDEFSCVVDLVYRPGGTDLERAARERGIPTVDGLEVLVQQGALSYEAWTGRTADRAKMRQAARDFDAPPIATDTR